MRAVSLLLLASINPIIPAQAASVVAVDLNQLHGGAAFVFVGRVVSNTVELDTTSGLVVTYTTFEVLDTLKGRPDGSYTIKQLGGQLEGSDIRFDVPGVPQFEENNDYVLFLPLPSQIGFSSPIGLWQGSFAVFRDENGRPVVSNGRDVAELLASVPAPAIPAQVQQHLAGLPARGSPGAGPARSQLNLEDFLEIVRRLGR